MLCAEPKEHKHFPPGIRPGRPVTGVTEKLFMCQMFMCLFCPLGLAAGVMKVDVAKGVRDVSSRGWRALAAQKVENGVESEPN